MKKIHTTLIIFILTFSVSGFTQEAWTEKCKCSQTSYDGKIYNGSRINVFYTKGSDTIKSSSYRDSALIILPDSEKFVIIEQLLKYENDTSLYCLYAHAKLFGGELECRFWIDIKVESLPLSIDALYRINGIAYPYCCWVYSCYPVLYDTLDKIVINEKPELIKEVYKKYKIWFEECKQKGKIVAYCPFNDGRYVWYKGYKSFYPKEE